MNRVLYVQYTNPAGYPPLEHSSRILANAGWQVSFLGTDGLGTAKLEFPPHDHITVRRMRFCPAGWRQKLHYLQFCLWVLYWTLRWRPNWVYASDLLAAPIALLVSLFPFARVIYHEHDSPGTRDSGFIKFCLAARKSLAHRATLCVLPNQKRAERFAELMGVRQTVMCVWNCPALEEVSSRRQGRDAGILRLLYHGSIVPSRLPLTVLSALALMPDKVDLSIIGYETVGHAGYVKEFQELACQLGVAKGVRFLGAMSRTSLMKASQGYDIGLALMPNRTQDMNLHFMVGASNKPFDYLACGLALLISDLPDWRTTFVEPGYGLACNPDDPESIAEALRWFLDHPREMRDMGEQGRQRILEEWNYERQFDGVLRTISEID